MIRPRFEITQDKSLNWLVEVHVASELSAARGRGERADEAKLRERLTKLVQRCACRAPQIARRGHQSPDCGHLEWTKMGLYDVTRDPRGADMSARTAAFERAAMELLERAYEGEERAPADIVHVTCTGYVSPSAPQRLVAARGWGSDTRVTHAYHMGCYAAVPAIRVACGLVASGAATPSLASPASRRADIVHTELCSMHMDPSNHSAEAFVVQSLFADGAVRYQASLDDHPPAGGGLRVLSLKEAILPRSESSMRWVPSAYGMRMTLARDVPQAIGGALTPFLRGLFAQAGLDFSQERRSATFAVHPGGPKILDQVRDALEIDEAQIATSRGVLRDFGNMSSATLPYVFARTLEDDACANGALIASLAFGPGLSVCGALLRKETGADR